MDQNTHELENLKMGDHVVLNSGAEGYVICIRDVKKDREVLLELTKKSSTMSGWVKLSSGDSDVPKNYESIGLNVYWWIYTHDIIASVNGVQKLADFPIFN